MAEAWTVAPLVQPPLCSRLLSCTCSCLSLSVYSNTPFPKQSVSVRSANATRYQQKQEVSLWKDGVRLFTFILASRFKQRRDAGGAVTRPHRDMWTPRGHHVDSEITPGTRRCGLV